MDSFTDRTSLSPGPQINVLEDPDYLDLTQIETSKPHSTQFLPPVEMIGPGAPKKAYVNELIMEESSVTPSQPERSGAGELLVSFNLGSTGQQICRMENLSPVYSGLENEQFKSPGKRASRLYHLRHHYSKRQRGFRFNPKFYSFFSAQESSRKIGISLSSLTRSGKRNKMLRSSLPWRENSWEGYSGNMAIRKRNNISCPDLPWDYKI